jgi:hypothetical protein
MPFFVLHHRHDSRTCDASFASWQGFDSPLRHGPADCTCLAGGHDLWWRVEAVDRHAALALLPPYLAHRTCAIPVRRVQIP